MGTREEMKEKKRIMERGREKRRGEDFFFLFFFPFRAGIVRKNEERDEKEGGGI